MGRHWGDRFKWGPEAACDLAVALLADLCPTPFFPRAKKRPGPGATICFATEGKNTVRWQEFQVA